ncbi:MAG: Vi polysaccharide biosynthesis UDP-N-acetylglucosamine C-6 dehydrogenase TviB [Gammaproteobacteria bacterium]|nr:MAG: Vi polysaccharide biosynthesis UDP-N-acetylglucosamine C-6 dehydrogenase TviB [Gammaproteobacteria bacterium]
MLELKNSKICIVGLGYVGLPLAVEFGKKFDTIGLDVDSKRIAELREGKDHTLEVEDELLAEATRLSYTDDITTTSDCNIYIVTVPTPIDEFKTPDLRPLISASRALGKVVKKDDIVIYESTVYPGATEEVCISEIEKVSGLKYNQDFFAGYSPERINPGDKEHRVTNILKVTSGSNEAVANLVDALYQSVITAGTHKASSIKVAEAAKVIENTQRDVNIALVNELSLIFDKLEIDTLEVLEAAGTKWNFLPFRPGLVGGHCIGVDPYYLTYKAQSIGYHPEVILSGRRINDSMGPYVTESTIKLMLKKRIQVVDSNVLVMGLTFKENCPDIRNTRVVDIIDEFQNYNANVDIYDPWADADEVKEEYGLELIKKLDTNSYDAIILAVSHNQFREMGSEAIKALGKQNCVIYDVKHILEKSEVDGRL